MKGISLMKRILAFLLTVCMVFALFACGSDPVVTQTVTSTQEQTETTGGATPVKTKEIDYPQVKNLLTWDKINAIPVATNDMTSDQLRQICLDYIKLQFAFQWTPNEDFEYTIGSRGKPIEFPAEVVYAGIPYNSPSGPSGNIYTIMNFYDSETGILDVKERGSDGLISTIANNCASACFWAWSRVVNSTKLVSEGDAHRYLLWDFVEKNGFLPVGPYTYDKSISGLQGSVHTMSICDDNGPQIMFQSYAAAKPADGLVTYYPKNSSTYASHVQMFAQVPHVEYNSDGTIDGDKSYVMIHEQTSSKATLTDEEGTRYTTVGKLNQKFTFKQMFAGGYIPFTFAEFLKQDPVEKGAMTLDFSGDGITFEQLKNATVSSNYSIVNVTIKILDKNNNEVYHLIAYPSHLNMNHFKMIRMIYRAVDVFAEKGNHTVTLTGMISTGETFNLYQGKLLPKA